MLALGPMPGAPSASSSSAWWSPSSEPPRYPHNLLATNWALIAGRGYQPIDEDRCNSSWSVLGHLVPRPKGRAGFKGEGRTIRVSTCLLYCYAQPMCSAVRYYSADRRRLMVCVLLQLVKRAPDCPRGAEGWCKHLLPCTFELVAASLMPPRGCPDAQGEQRVLWPQHGAEASFEQAAPAVLLGATRQPAGTPAPTTPQPWRPSRQRRPMPRAAMATAAWVSRLTLPGVRKSDRLSCAAPLGLERLNPRRRCSSTQRVRVRYAATDDILGGGLNNMLLHLAQLLEQACASNATLVLPFLHADPLEKRGGTTCKVVPTDAEPVPGHSYQCKALALSDVFDLDYLRARLPCSVTEEVPAGAAVTLLKLESINADWDHTRPMVASVYAAVRPSRAVQAMLDRLLEMAALKAGRNWSAVHMP